MSKWAALTGSNTGMLVSAAAVAVAAVGAGFYINSRTASAPDAVVLPETSAPMPEVTPDQDAAPVVADVDTGETPPSIDEVRVEADGLTIVAGRASPGSKVSVLLDGVENTSVTTDAGGGFAAITTIQPKTTAQVLTIVQRLGDTAVSSLDEIILAPSSASLAVAEAVPQVGTDTGAPSGSFAATTSPDAPDTIAENAPGVDGATDPDIVAAVPTARADEGSVSDAGAAAGTAAASGTTDAPADGSAVGQSLRADAQTADRSVAQTDVAQGADASETSQSTPGTAVADLAAAPDTSIAVDTLASTEPSVNDAVSGGDVDDVAGSAPPAPSVTVFRSTSDGVEVLGPSLGPSDVVSIDTISYSDAGDVQLTGRAKSDADVVRVYVNNRAISELTVDPDGRWRGELPGIDTGVYTLRVDEVDVSGDVISRVETPFKREDPQLLVGANTDAASAKLITVQTGATLWAIARDRYGEGLLYVQVFEANKDAIRNPDLIYPGQVFALPD